MSNYSTLPEIKEELSLDALLIEKLVARKKPLLRDDLIDLRNSLMTSLQSVQIIQDMLAH